MVTNVVTTGDYIYPLPSIQQLFSIPNASRGHLMRSCIANWAVTNTRYEPENADLFSRVRLHQSAFRPADERLRKPSSHQPLHTDSTVASSGCLWCFVNRRASRRRKQLLITIRCARRALAGIAESFADNSLTAAQWTPRLDFISPRFSLILSY